MSSWEYIRLFGKGEKQPSDTEIRILSSVVDSIQDNTKSHIPAGYTYFGQFIAHDLTFLGHGTREPSATALDPSELSTRRNPALDLDSIYGGGLGDSQIPFDHATGMFILGRNASGSECDLPREDNGRARIGDQRNDENLLIAQIQLLFMKFHNKLVRILASHGESNPSKLFELAKQEVIHTYQYLVLHDFAKRILPGPSIDRKGNHTESIYDIVITECAGELLPRETAYPKMSLEFAGAALRFGHSMVDTQYDLRFRTENDDEKVRLQLHDLFAATGVNIDYKHPLRSDFNIDWRFFFDFKNYSPSTKVHPNLARKIDLSVNLHMSNVPGKNAAPDSFPIPKTVNMVERNLLRGRELGLKSGQQICQQLVEMHPDVAKRIGLKPLNLNLPFFIALENAGAPALLHDTPLWTYVLLEADKQQNSRLGPLGGWIVADGLVAAAQVAETSIYKDWKAEHFPFLASEALRLSRTGNAEIDLADIAAFVQPDLVSQKGQEHQFH